MLHINDMANTNASPSQKITPLAQAILDPKIA
jgi:hypothetical protein